MDRPEWYGPALTQPNRGSVAFPQDNSNDSTADVRAKRQLHVCMYVLAVNEQLSAVYCATLLWSHSLPLQVTLLHAGYVKVQRWRRWRRRVR